MVLFGTPSWEDDLPVVDGKIALTLTRDRPEEGLKAGDVIWVEYGGVRYSRPTTVWARSIPRRVRHEPLGAVSCACGGEFDSPEQAARHMKASVPAWSRVRFRYDGEHGEQIARPLEDHEMAFWPDDGKVTCACGFALSAPDLNRAGPGARDHVRGVLRARVGVAE